MRATNSSLSPRCNFQIEIHAEDSWTVFLCQVESRNHSPEMFLEGGRRDGGGRAAGALFCTMDAEHAGTSSVSRGY